MFSPSRRPSLDDGRGRNGGFIDRKFVFVLSLLSVLVLVGIFVSSRYLFVGPERLYHMTWQSAQEYVYEPAPLAEWKDWEHKFDGQIKTDEEAIQRANEMNRALHDGYTYLIPPEQVAQRDHGANGVFIGVGLLLDVELDAAGNPVLNSAGQAKTKTDSGGNPLIREVLKDSPAEKAGLKNGDAIKSVDGHSCQGLSSNELVGKITGAEGTAVVLEIVRAGQLLPSFNITRGPIPSPPSVTTKMLSNGIGYIRLDTFGRHADAEDMKKGLEQLVDAKAIVFDLRNNLGGFIDNAIDISSMFVETGTLVSIKSRIAGDPANPQYSTEVVRVTATEVIRETTRTDNPGHTTTATSGRKMPYLLAGRPMVILVNGNSASASELTSGAIRDNGVAILVGLRMYGKGIGQSTLFMPNGTRLQVTTLRYFTPKGTWLGDAEGNRQGMQPDIEVAPSKDGFQPASADDNQLEKAVDYLKTKL